MKDLNLNNRKSKSQSRSPEKKVRDENEENKVEDVDGEGDMLLTSHLSKVLNDVCEQLTPHPMLAAAEGESSLGGMQLLPVADNSQLLRAEPDGLSVNEDSLGENFASKVMNFRSMDQRCEPAQMNSVCSPVEIDDNSKQYLGINI